MPSLPTPTDPAVRAQALADLAAFRSSLYASLTRRADELFELTDALLCTDTPVGGLAGLSLAPEHRRGHGSLYAGLNRGGADIQRVRASLAGLRVPRIGGRIVLAVDVSAWLRPAAVTSPDRLGCHVSGYNGQDAYVPGWPYQVVAALESGSTSWTHLLDARRLGPTDDNTTATAAQLREVTQRLLDAGQQQPGDPDILIVADAGYDLPRLAWLTADLPVLVAGRLASNRVLCLPPPPTAGRYAGRPALHGPPVALADPATHPAPTQATSTRHPRYGTVAATSFDRLHPKLTRRAGWAMHLGPLPVIQGTVIRVAPERLDGNRDPKPMWLWTAATDLDAAEVDRIWQAYLRRFDLEHTFRFFKQTLGWTTPRLRDPVAADRWTWLVIAAHTQLRLARDLTTDLRRPWERPAPPGRLTPGRVRRGFRYLHAKLPGVTGAPKPSRPGPGRPKGSRNRRVASRHTTGKTLSREYRDARQRGRLTKQTLIG